jgi:dihydrofolate reductase
MRKLIVFNHVSLDGYFVDSNGSLSWAKTRRDDVEWNAFVKQNTSSNGPLLFGRKTYEVMIQYWPTPMAKQNDATIADRTNALPKVVFSKTLDDVSWSNTRLVKDDLTGEVMRMKQESGVGMTILGCGTLISHLADAGMID